MAAERYLPPAPLGPEGPYLMAMLDVLDDIHTLLRDRLAPQVVEPEPESDGAAPLVEPAPDDQPEPEAVAVSEPAPRRRGRPPRNPNGKVA